MLICLGLLVALQAAAGLAAPSSAALDVRSTEVQFIISGIASYALRFLRNWDRFGWFTVETPKRIQILIAAIVAFATSLGIHFGFDGATGTLVVTGLSWQIADHVWDFIRSFFLQQFVYDVAINKPTDATGPAIVMPTPGPRE